MQPESVSKLASYIYVEKELITKLIKTGMTFSSVDDIRTILVTHMNPGYDISSPLNAYDDLVLSLASHIVDSNIDLIKEEIEKAQAEMIGIEGPPTTIEEPVPELEPIQFDRPELQDAQRIGVESSQISQIKIPNKIEVRGRLGHKAYTKHKSVSWRKRNQSGMSSQEQFVYSRREQPVQQTQREYIEHFKVYRTKSSILVKQKRLGKQLRIVNPSPEEKQSTGFAP